MLVIDSNVIAEHPGIFEPVESINQDDAATLLDCWEYALKQENLKFEEVEQVWLAGGCYYFEVGSPDQTFDLFDFIEDKSDSTIRLSNLYARERIAEGTSRGLPQHDPWYDPMDLSNADDMPSEIWASGEFGDDYDDEEDDHRPKQIIGSSRSNVAPEDEDSEKTGVFDEADFSTGGLSAVKTFTLRVDRTGGTFEVPEGEPIVVGRSSSDAQVQILGDSNISRRHAELSVGADGNLYVKDLGSANGTFVGGLNIKGRTVMVKPGQTFSLYRESISVVKESMS